MELGGVIYQDRLTAIPVVEIPIPEFMAGIESPSDSSIALANTDKLITNLQNQRLIRGKRVTIKEHYIHQGGSETITRFTGIANASQVGLEAVIALTPLNLGLLDVDFPINKITTALFPNALDIDFVIPYIIGTTKKIPLALILANDASTPPQYLYLVGRGDLTVDVVYRDGLVISSFSGTSQGGNTSTTIRLAAGDTKDDDFYNDAFILITSGTGSGQVRRITDYVKATKTATITPSWSPTPTTSGYVIREWKKITQTISGAIHTLIEFAIRQRDRDRLYDRNRMSADITGLQTERNPARAIESILALYNIATNATAFSNAATTISGIGSLNVDGAVTETRRLIDVLNEICLIGRLRLRINTAGEVEPIVDGSQDTVYGNYASNDNIVSYDPPRDTPLNNLWKSLKVGYRRQFDNNTYRLTSAQRSIFTEGKRDEVLNFDFIFDKTTADKVANYLANRKRSLDETIKITLGHEARNRKNGELINLAISELGRAGIHEIVGESHNGVTHSFDTVKYDTTIFTYSALSLPSDPVTDAQADFSKTPPDAVSGLAVVWTSLSPTSVKAKLTWTKPTQNYKDCLVEWKLTSDVLYNSAGKTTGTQTEIIGLTPGLLYDFRVTSINNFDLIGGVASLTIQLAPGDTGAPSTPTGLVSQANLFEATWEWNANPEADIDYYEVEMYISSSGGSPIAPTPLRTVSRHWGHILNTGNLTTTVTRWVRVRAVDFSGNASAWTSRVSASTSSILQDDVTNNEMASQGAGASGSGNWGPGTLVSATITTRGFPVVIEFSVGRIQNTHASFTIEFGAQLQRDGGTIESNFANVILNPSGVGNMGAHFSDTPPAGSHTYSINKNPANPAGSYSNARLIVREKRR